MIVGAQPNLHNKRAIATLVSDIDRDIYKFEKKSLLTEFKRNRTFRDAIMSGAYFYHQGKICLYHPDVFVGSKNGIKISDVIEKDPGEYLLSHYARRITINKTNAQRGSQLCWKMGRPKLKHCRENTSDNTSIYGVKINHAKKYSREAYREGDQYSEAVLCSMDLIQGFIDNGQGNGPDDTFGDFFIKLMSQRKLTIKQLADKTDIPERTIERMRKDEGYKPSIEYLLACCMVMRLPPWDSDKLFNLAGIVLRINDKKERCNIALLHVFFKEGSIRVCDEVLAIAGLPTLSSIIESNKKINRSIRTSCVVERWCYSTEIIVKAVKNSFEIESFNCFFYDIACPRKKKEFALLYL